jgi:hypothetical protein
MFSLFKENIGRFFCEEFLFRHTKSGTRIQTIGQKHVILSKKIIQDHDWSNISNSEARPFFEGDGKVDSFGNSFGSIKGVQLMLKIDQETFIAIKLIDQNLNDKKPEQYTYQTMVTIAGTCKFNIVSENQQESKEEAGYVQVVAAVLRRNLISKDILVRAEAFAVLKRALDLMMTMRIPSLEYLALHPFSELKIKDFFRPQEILLGKSICDICLSEPETIKAAFDEFKRNFDKWSFPRA